VADYCTPAVHPRWRGEHVEPWPMVGTSPGSSPLARGTLRQGDEHPTEYRFIPAGAGNTVSEAPRVPASAVHPRWRGEHTGAKLELAAGTGSSPLARGTPQPQLPNSQSLRFIPAGAGNTRAPVRRGRLGAVHPRWRGEHAGIGTDRLLPFGSSPLARGTRRYTSVSGAALRFIPAGAGNTPAPGLYAEMIPVHPRWRGEHYLAVDALGNSAGSSPLARGTLISRTRAVNALRFIPAGAGNTPRRSFSHSGVPVHPRWRGEHAMSAVPASAPVGSSPLARGTQRDQAFAELVERFIPAGAGNTRRAG